MTIEDRLRRAIHDRTSSVEVDEQAGLERITGELLTSGDDMPPDPPSTPQHPQIRTSRKRLLAAAVVALVALVGGGLMLLSGGGGDGDSRVDIADGARSTEVPSTQPPPTDAGDTDTTDDETAQPSPTEPVPDGSTGTTGDGDPASGSSDQPSGTTAPTGAADPFERQVVWPRLSSDVRFDDPVAAARSFALYYARFDDPVIGGFRAADSHSGEVPVQPRIDGPETLVRVAVSPDGEWFVTGSGTADITVHEPRSDGTIDCPLATSGTALAFEGTVQVRIDAYQPDGDRVEMGRGFVTGSGAPPAGPFSGQIACTARSGVEDVGVVAYWTDDASGELDGPLQIVTVPVGLP